LLVLYMYNVMVLSIGADLCSLLGARLMGKCWPCWSWVRKGVAPSCNGGLVRGTTLGKFWKFYMPNRAFWGMCDNWCTERVHFAVLNGEVFLSYWTAL